MCHLCEQYGNGNIWYLNPLNYARNMYKLRKPDAGFKGAEVGPEAEVGLEDVKIVEAIEKGREEYERAVKEVYDNTRRMGMESQVLPLKDAEKVLELCSPMGMLSCMCRKGVRATDERNELEYTCMGLGVGMLKWERWPERYKGGVKFVSVEEAKEWTRKMDKKGFVHVLMGFGLPFIGGFCQCDYPDCLVIRDRIDFGYGLLKSHYLAVVDYDICNGCGICAQRCQFGALKFEVTIQKANIDQFKCFGCGLCETGCPRGAIKLVEKESLPALAEVW